MSAETLQSHRQVLQLSHIAWRKPIRTVEIPEKSAEHPSEGPIQQWTRSALQRATLRTQTEHTRVGNFFKLDSGRTPFLSRTPSLQTSRKFKENATIVLVGSRGSGKRSLGFIGATHLGRRFITEDHYFEETTGISRKSFLSRYGNKEFLKRNVEVLKKMLEDNTSNCIIECGMGSLAREAQDTLREYSHSHPVIYILRNADRVRRLLKLSEPEYKRLEYADSVHRSCSNFEYYNLHDPSCETNPEEASQDRASPNYSFGLKDAKQDFSNFLDFVSGRGLEESKSESPFSLAAVPPEFRPFSRALCIGLSDLLRNDVNLSELGSGGGDVVELRIDIWVANMLSVIGKQVAMIRRHVGVPVIFAVDEDFLHSSPSQVSDKANPALPQFLGPTILAREEAAMVILRHSLRLGVEYVVFLLQYSDESIHQLLASRGATKLICHYTMKQTDSQNWLDPSRLTVFQKAEALGCDIVRLVQAAASEKDNDDLKTFSNHIAHLGQPHALLAAYNLGVLGHKSLITNQIFSPVTHPAIKNRIPGIHQPTLTAPEAMQALFQSSVLDPLHFYIVGAAVSYSLSPAMHNAAYRACGMSHDFQVRQASSISDLQRLSQDQSFGGAGIAQPFKVGIMSSLAFLSHHAKAIGAVNTLLPLRALPDGSPRFLFNQANDRNKSGPIYAWYGDNTDWIGTMTCLRRNTSPRNVVQPSRTTGLVIGAGGMARAAIYAMIQLGCRKIFIFNRTVENAEIVAKHFNSWAAPLANRGQIVTVFKSRDEPWPTDCRPPTLVVSCVPAHSVFNLPAANFEMPQQWLASPSGGVIMEMAYKPRDTPLLQQIRRLRQQTGVAWVTVDFLEVLPEQGIAQFELMTGRKAPREVMRSAVLQNYEGDL